MENGFLFLTFNLLKSRPDGLNYFFRSYATTLYNRWGMYPPKILAGSLEEEEVKWIRSCLTPETEQQKESEISRTHYSGHFVCDPWSAHELRRSNVAFFSGRRFWFASRLFSVYAQSAPV
jgi:hypothetical protein